MNVEQIVIAYLTEHGHDGLCLVEEGRIECGCGLDDLAPCGNLGAECVPARGNWESGFRPAVIASQPGTTVGFGGIQPATFAKLDARRRAHGWTWDEYLEIIGSLEEAFDEP